MVRLAASRWVGATVAVIVEAGEGVGGRVIGVVLVQL